MWRARAGGERGGGGEGTTLCAAVVVDALFPFNASKTREGGWLALLYLYPSARSRLGRNLISTTGGGGGGGGGFTQVVFSGC